MSEKQSPVTTVRSWAEKQIPVMTVCTELDHETEPGRDSIELVRETVAQRRESGETGPSRDSGKVDKGAGLVMTVFELDVQWK